MLCSVDLSFWVLISCHLNDFNICKSLFERFLIGLLLKNYSHKFILFKNRLFKKNLFIFVCIGSLLLCVAFSSCGERGLLFRCGVQASHCSGFSCCGAWGLGVQASVVVALRLQSTDSVVVAHRLSCSTACGIFPDQGSNPCPLHWQAGS